MGNSDRGSAHVDSEKELSGLGAGEVDCGRAADCSEGRRVAGKIEAKQGVNIRHDDPDGFLPKRLRHAVFIEDSHAR